MVNTVAHECIGEVPPGSLKTGRSNGISPQLIHLNENFLENWFLRKPVISRKQAFDQQSETIL